MDDDKLEPPPMLLPGSEARHLARAIIVLTILVLALAGALIFIATPGFMGDTDRGELRPIGILVLLVGFGMLFTGLAWMARIYRSMLDVEPDQDAWRYRSR